VLKGIYTNTPCDLEDDEQYEKYEREENKLSGTAMEKKWRKVVRRSWNGILHPGKSACAKGVLMRQLEELDRIFLTHFQNAGQFYMTNAASWNEMWPLYVEAIIRHANGLAERPEESEALVKICERVSGRVRFALKDYEGMHLPPPFPILTKSVVPMMVKAVDDIEMALYEVSWNPSVQQLITPIIVCIFPFYLSTFRFSTKKTKSNTFDFVCISISLKADKVEHIRLCLYFHFP
jgi:hypothetical protein